MKKQYLQPTIEYVSCITTLRALCGSVKEINGQEDAQWAPKRRVY